MRHENDPTLADVVIDTERGAILNLDGTVRKQLPSGDRGLVGDFARRWCADRGIHWRTRRSW